MSTIKENKEKNTSDDIDYSPKEVEEYIRKCGIDPAVLDKEIIEFADKLALQIRITKGKIKQEEFEKKKNNQEYMIMRSGFVTGEDYLSDNIAFAFRKGNKNAEAENKIIDDLKKIEMINKIDIEC